MKHSTIALLCLTMVSVPAFSGNTEDIENNELQILTWGGKYYEAQEKAFLDSFEEEYNVDISNQSLGESVISRLRAENERPNNTRIDVADVTAGGRISACDEGLLEPIHEDDRFQDVDGYQEGAVKECGVATSNWSVTISSTNSEIDSAEDFFNPDIEGNRGLKKTPRATLEFALLGAGVPKDEVYDKLRTEEGIELAFDTLDKIKDRIKWWDYSSGASQMLMAGDVVATTSYTSRMVYLKRFEDKDRHEIYWDDHLQGYGYFVVPATSDNKDLAKDLIRYATSEKNVDMWKYTGTASMRTELPEDVTDDYTGLPEHKEKALMQDEQFWADYNDELTERFNNWMSQ